MQQTTPMLSNPPLSLQYIQAGEALTVSDPDEAWIFHVLSDETTTSAIWAAQRVPDDHVSVVANQFIIKEARFGFRGGCSVLHSVSFCSVLFRLFVVTNET